MAEMMQALEMLAYLGSRADSVDDRRLLDELLKSTDTTVDAETSEVAASA
jgi:hypothetical protein